MLNGGIVKEKYASFTDMYNKCYGPTSFEKSIYPSIIALDTVNNAPRTEKNYKELNKFM